MQTFLPYKDSIRSAECLDNKRLGKQRLEAIQIARCLLSISSPGWKNHPAVKMWKNHEAYLVKIYLKAMIDEWDKRGFKGEKCKEHFIELSQKVERQNIVAPNWLNEDFCTSHQSNLLRKNEGHYSKYFSVANDLPYLWPV